MSMIEARIAYEKDGTVPMNCSNDLLEFRVHLSEPMFLRSFGEYAREQNLLQLLLCWGDILEFRTMRPGKDPVRDKANLIRERYTQDSSEYKFPDDSIGPELFVVIHDAFDMSAGNSGKLIPSATFDGLLHVSLCLMHERMFTDYKTSESYAALMTAMRSTYNQVKPDDFEFMGEIGRGGFASVIHCKKKSTGIHYAMKVQTKVSLLKVFRVSPTRVTSELEALASCDYPFIVNLDYAFQISNMVMLAMEISTCKSSL